MSTAAELMAPMLKRRFFAVIWRLRDGQSLAPLLAEHLAYMIALEAQGKLLASGPVTTDDGTPTGAGLTVLRCDSRAEAEALAGADPFAKAGLRDFDLLNWTLMEGRIGMAVDLSRGTFSFT